MAEVAGKIQVLEGCQRDALPLEQLLAAGQPAVLKNLVGDWALVRAGLNSSADAMRYLRSFDNGRPIQYNFGEPQIGGRPFYNADFTQLNTTVKREPLARILDEIETHLHDEQPPTYYAASIVVDACLPGFRAQHQLGFAAHGIDPPPSIWIGNRTIASCHYDAPNNIACCAVGRRRFTLFPPEQILNLYPGPLELTPGGQAISVVDFKSPDFAQHPRFRDALAAGQSAVLEPGDAVFIPSMWWHHVEGLAPFNALVNYWWSSVPAFMSTPMNALYHALWTLRDRPERERQAWKQVFDFYVFGDKQRAVEHLPEQARGLLESLDETQARQIRAMLINKLNH